MRNKIAITAIISNICMTEPALYAKNPMAQNMIRTTAIKYKIDPIISICKD